MTTRATMASGAIVLLGLAISLRAAATAPSGPVAPPRLMDTGLYEAGRPGVVAARNRAFSPQYPLWTDGATKRRWVFLPQGSTIDATNIGEWDMPVGTRFWKEFSFGGRKVETRFLWRASKERWVFASYAWNADGTDAVIAANDGVPGAADVGAGRQHTIPSVADCRACHESRRVEPLGFNALQLSTDRDPGAVHAEPLAPGMVTLKTLADEGRLRGASSHLAAQPPRIRAADPLTRSALGYFAANCGTCHNRDSGIALLGASLRHMDVIDGDAVVRAMIGKRTSWQRPGSADGTTLVIDPASPDSSAILTRMHSRRPSSQMPPLGTVVADRAGMDLIARWIRSVAQF